MPAEGSPPSLVIATIGMHASASTWVFNVVRELVVEAVGRQSLVTGYADEVAQLPDHAGRHLVIKSHHGSVGLDDWLVGRGAGVLLSVRDPRDACLSMSQRFKAPLGHTVQWIANDCNRMLRLAPHGYPLLRYEDRFFADDTTAKRIAVTLGVSVTPEELGAICDRYSTEAVRAFAQALPQLPAERLTMVNDFPMDRETQILATHIGDTRVGKWRDLPDRLQAELTRVYRPFLDRFGYPC